jgi:hypothetical protein
MPKNSTDPMATEIPTPESVLRAVDVFNMRYGAMESALWSLSLRARESILTGETLLTEVLVWTVKCWWGIQGTRHGTAALAAAAIRRLALDRGAFRNTFVDSDTEEHDCIHMISVVLTTMRESGVPRMEFSLISKVLHWLMPWRLPPYDSLVRRRLGIPSAASPFDAYGRIVRWHRATTALLLSMDNSWMGSIEPMTPFRALNKFLWYEGGGNVNPSVVIKQPNSWIEKASARAAMR